MTDFQTSEYEYSISQTWRRVSRVHTLEILGCWYPCLFSARVPVYLFSGIKIRNVVLACVLGTYFGVRRLTWSRRRPRRMLPRVSTAPESRILVVLLDTLGDPMSRVSGDVPFAEYEHGRRAAMFPGYEHTPKTSTGMIWCVSQK